MPEREAERTGQQHLSIEGLPGPVEIRHHPTARRLTLRVSATRRGVILTIPRTCRRDEAMRFVKKHLGWIEARLGELPEAVPFTHGAEIPYLGAPHRIVFSNGNRRRGCGVVEVCGEPQTQLVLHVHGAAVHAPRRLRDWLAGQARDALSERVRYHEERLGLSARRISVRDQRSRWGSCSSTGTLSFSWRLILAPPVVLDYVAAHEVAHLAEMNHGPRFWQLVRTTMPDMDRANAWLRQHGRNLHRYG